MASNWEAFQFLLGEWQGGQEEDPIQGYGIFSFNFELDDNILVRKNRTILPATQDRGGYTHEDLLIIYAESSGHKRAIYFDNEEHIINYAVTISPDQKNIILESAPETSAPQFRFTYIKTGDDSLEACFEMTPPGQPGAYFMYLKGQAKRISQK
jgi:hypothetical protein